MTRPEELLRRERWHAWHLYRSSGPRRYLTPSGGEVILPPGSPKIDADATVPDPD